MIWQALGLYPTTLLITLIVGLLGGCNNTPTAHDLGMATVEALESLEALEVKATPPDLSFYATPSPTQQGEPYHINFLLKATDNTVILTVEGTSDLFCSDIDLFDGSGVDKIDIGEYVMLQETVVLKTREPQSFDCAWYAESDTGLPFNIKEVYEVKQ